MIKPRSRIDKVRMSNAEIRRAVQPGGFSFSTASSDDQYRILIGGCCAEPGEDAPGRDSVVGTKFVAGPEVTTDVI
jgi:hypothetical protein